MGELPDGRGPIVGDGLWYLLRYYFLLHHGAISPWKLLLIFQIPKHLEFFNQFRYSSSRFYP